MKAPLWTSRSIFALLLPWILGLLAWGAWHYEIQLRMGWRGLAWLQVEHHYSVWLGLLFTSISFAWPARALRGASFGRTLISICLIFLVSLLGYYLSKSIFYALFQPDIFTRPDSEWFRLKLAVALLLIVLFAGSAFFFIKQRLLFQSNRLHILTFIFVLFTLVPASLGATELLINWSNAERFVDAVKMGYPLFWSNGLLGTTVWFMAHKLI